MRSRPRPTSSAIPTDGPGIAPRPRTRPTKTSPPSSSSAANRARSHGGYAATAALLSRAAELTPDPSRRALRYVDGGGIRLHRRQLGARAGQSRTRASLTSGTPRSSRSVPARSHDRLRRSARRRLARPHRASPSDHARRSRDPRPARHPQRARDVARRDADGRDLRQCGSHDPTRRPRAAQSLALPPDAAPTSGDLVLDALAELFAEGYDNAVPALRRAVVAVRSDTAAREYPRRLALGCWPAFALSDDERGQVVGRRMRRALSFPRRVSGPARSTQLPRPVGAAHRCADRRRPVLRRMRLDPVGFNGTDQP